MKTSLLNAPYPLQDGLQEGNVRNVPRALEEALLGRLHGCNRLARATQLQVLSHKCFKWSLLWGLEKTCKSLRITISNVNDVKKTRHVLDS